MTYQLGIDTGGTYTDAVIIDDNKRIIATHKSLTTSYDLSVGINNVIQALPTDLLKEIDLVALSTTLSTNAVVEGRGAPVAVLLPGYTQKQLTKSGINDIVSSERICLMPGAHDAIGVAIEPLDMALATRTVIEQNSKVSAFAVSGMFGTRNTAHEIALRDLIVKLTGKPVACGHELASSLGAPRRALTATLNARMIPFIQTLIESLQNVLLNHSIDAPLMIVKGDGSLINVDTAQLQPVATILSGPAASVLGACALSGRKNALVVDMGGTTTDIAVVKNGQADLCEEGARVGNWQPMVEAINAYSIGLGGDSEIRFDGKMSISTRRVVPVSLLIHQYPELLSSLERQMKGLSNPRHNRFALRRQHNQILIEQLTRAERAAWDRLEQGPLDIDALAEANRPMTRAVARLERMGLVIYSGFTPSDATHVLGMSHHWNTQAAIYAAQLWARQMRYLYGCGDWSLNDPKEPSEAVFALVTEQISHKVIEAGLNQHGLLNEAQSKNLASLLGKIVLSNDSTTALFDLKFASDFPLVGVGGPAADFLPEVAKKLGLQLILPEHANTANALGAVMASVVQSVKVSITQPSFGKYYVFYGSQPVTFETLENALTHARELALSEAYKLAVSSGAQEVTARLEESSAHVDHDIDGELFVSATITGIAQGRPTRLHDVRLNRC